MRYFGFNVKKVMKRVFPSWLWLESMLVACLDDDLLLSIPQLLHHRPCRCSRFELPSCHHELRLSRVVSRPMTPSSRQFYWCLFLGESAYFCAANVEISYAAVTRKTNYTESCSSIFLGLPWRSSSNTLSFLFPPTFSNTGLTLVSAFWRAFFRIGVYFTVRAEA